MTTVAQRDVASPAVVRAADGLSLLERARLVQPLLQQHAAGNDEAGQLDPEVVQALRQNDFFGMWVPIELGGSELDPVRSLEVIEALAYGDASASWVTMAVCLATGAAGAYLPDSALPTLFAGDHFPAIAGQGTRPGRAVATEGGFHLSGSWSFGSGLKHSAYIHTLGTVEGTGETRIFIVPVEQAVLDYGSWDVMGLRGTGSVDYTLDNVFVPADFTYINTIKTPLRGGAFYGLGILQFALIGHSGWALGLSRRLLDELAALTAAKVGRPGQQADTETFQSEFALAEAQYHSARAFVFQAWRDLSNTLYLREPVTTRQQTLIRLALHNATWSAERISEFVYRAGGTTALRAGVIQQYFRDMHAGTQHVTSAPAVLQACGRELAGFATNQQWHLLGLIDQPGV
jgi:alkylation response protein AidB-like acyl-CoA dehydrogenase